MIRFTSKQDDYGDVPEMEISLSIDQDSSLPQVVEAFKQFLLGCTFDPGMVSDIVYLDSENTSKWESVKGDNSVHTRELKEGDKFTIFEGDKEVYEHIRHDDVHDRAVIQHIKTGMVSSVNGYVYFI